MDFVDIENEYSIARLFLIVVQRIWIILLCCVVCGVSVFLFTKYQVSEKYTASVSLYVAPNPDKTTPLASLSELNYAQEVVNTYIEILKTNIFLSAVAEESDLGYSAQEINSMIRLQSVNQTEIFEISVTTTSPKDSLILANTFAKLAPQKIIAIKDADAVRVVDPATLPEEPSSPSVLKNTAIGAIFGLLVSVMVVVFLDMLDKRIKDENDILQNYQVPILGAVPKFDGKLGE